MYVEDDVEVAALAATEWDVIVVGAGAVGLVLAVSLARGGRRVLVLESGAAANGDAKDLNDAVVTGRPHLGILHGRARTVGGTTTLWGGQLTRFTPYDFEARMIMGDAAWPLSYDAVEPYYAEVAAMLDLDVERLDDAVVADEVGTAAGGDSSGCEIFFTRWLRESNLARWFAKDLEGRGGLAVVPECHATEILCRGDAAQIDGIRAVTSGGTRMNLRAAEVVLACGTIEISRLLLLTAHKSRGIEWAQNPNIGRYFQDHLDLVIGSVEMNDKKRFSDLFENVVIDGHKYQPKVRVRSSVLRELGCLNIASTMRFDSSIAEDIHLLKKFIKTLLSGNRIDKPWSSIKRMAGLGHVWFPLIWRYLRHRRILSIADRGISVIAHCEQRPLRDSRITLDTGRTDRFGDPVARLHWLVDEPLQVKSLQTFAAQLQDFLRLECDAALTILPGLASGDPAVLAQAQDSYHQCGGARMSRTREEGVVDSNCKVHGTNNLYVAGAAVFPSASFANPTYTAMAVACRLSRFLSGGAR